MSLGQSIVYWAGVAVFGAWTWAALHLVAEVQCQGRKPAHVYTWADGCVRVQR